MESVERWDVVVVGAGAAGLACAQALTAAGLRVVVLDARPRIGGRIDTRRTSAGSLELGAQVIHSTPGSALDLLVREAGLPTQPLSRDAAVIVVDRRRRWDAAALMREQSPAPWLVERQLARLSGGTVETAVSLVPSPAREVATAWLEQSIGGDLGHLDLDGLAAQTSGRSAQPERMLPGGFDQVPAALAGGVEVHLNCPVTTVRTAGPSVQTADGPVLTASAVVVTVPPSVVLADGLRFEPPLPEERMAAGRRLISGDGLVVVLHTAEPAPSSSWVLLARPPWGMWRTTAGSTVLAGHVKGSRTGEARAWPWRGEGADEVAGQVDPRLGPVTAVSICDWGSDPWARGTYSVPMAGAQQAADAWSAPIDRSVWFAGEACAADPAERGLVQGAIASGRRAAAQVEDALAH